MQHDVGHHRATVVCRVLASHGARCSLLAPQPWSGGKGHAGRCAHMRRLARVHGLQLGQSCMGRDDVTAIKGAGARDDFHADDALGEAGAVLSRSPCPLHPRTPPPPHAGAAAPHPVQQVSWGPSRGSLRCTALHRTARQGTAGPILGIRVQGRPVALGPQLGPQLVATSAAVQRDIATVERTVVAWRGAPRPIPLPFALLARCRPPAAGRCASSTWRQRPT